MVSGFQWTRQRSMNSSTNYANVRSGRLMKSSPAPGMILLSLGYAIAMFHRTSGAVFVMALAVTFEKEIPQLASIAAAFFLIYALLQLPSGVLADIIGARRLSIMGCITTGAGSILFATASSPHMAVAARCIVAVGCSVTFVTLIRYIKANWSSNRVATVSGRGIFIGNIGAISSAAPLALLLANFNWRPVAMALGIASLLLAVSIWTVMLEVRERPYPAGRLRTILRELRAVFSNRYNHLGFLVLAGLPGAYYALIGLWAMPMLQARGIQASIAAWGISAAIAGYAVGAPFLGWLGDRTKQRDRTLTSSCCAAALIWLLLVSGWPENGWMCLLLFLLGFSCGGFSLVYAIVTEYNPIEHAGSATAFVNMGIFTGAATMQWLATEALTANGGSYEGAMVPMAAGAAIAVIISLALRRTRRADTAASARSIVPEPGQRPTS